MSTIPFGALPGTPLQSAMRQVAAYYGVRAHLLKGKRRGGAPDDALAQARDALIWLLLNRHGWSANRISRALCIADRRTIRAAAQRHAEAIALFRETHNIKEAS